MFRFRKKSALQHYQDRLLALLYSGADPSTIQQVLLADKKLADYHSHIDKFTLPMVEAASSLTRQWGRKSSQTTVRNLGTKDYLEG